MRLALLLLLCACSAAPESQRPSCRIPLARELGSELHLAPIGATQLLLVCHGGEPFDSGDWLWVVDLEHESVEQRQCQPPCGTRGFGASLCVSSDGRRVLVGANSGTQAREPGSVLVFRWPQLELEFEVRGDQGGDWFGSSIAELADQDGDAQPDYVVGAPRSNSGALVLFSGADGRILRRIEGPEFGLALSNCADCDGDGVPDLAVYGVGVVELRSGRDLHVLRTLKTHGGMWPVLIGGAGLALLEDDGGSWLYSSHLTVTAWSSGQFKQVCQWKPDRYAHLYPCPGDPTGARLVHPQGNQLVSSDVSGKDELELGPLENSTPRAACGLPSSSTTRWRTAVVLAQSGGRGSELLLTTR